MIETRDFARALLLAGAAISALAAAPAIAQDAPPAEEDRTAQAPAGTSDLGDIVVTARRREESLLDVPIAITSFSGATLERQGAIDITEISDVTPNVTLEVSRGTNTTLTAFIRGVGQQDPVAGFEAGVGLYLDDVYLNRPQAAVLDIYDVERIEVLRGPQGTLYGRNTIGGAIKYVTRDLNPDEAEARVRGNVGNYDQFDLVASGSVPLTDDFRMGASIGRFSRGGFGRNLTNGLENYNKDIWALRTTLEAGRRGGFFLRVVGDYTRDESNPRNGHRLIPGQVSGAPVLDDVFDTRAGLVLPTQDVKAYGLSATAEYPLTETITLKNILAWRQDRSRTPIDFDSLPAADVDVPAIYRNRQFSEEFQVLYEGEKLQGIVGFYYLNARARNVFDVILATTAPAVLPGLTASTFGDVRTQTWAIFGDFTYQLSDQLSISVGGRYTEDERRARVIRRNLLNGPSPDLGGTGTQLGALTSDFTGDRTFSQFTPRASISWQPNEDNTLYASYQKGFKGGGFDPRGLSTAAPDLDGNGVRDPAEIFDYFLFDPEKVDSYEIGYKAALFDNRLTVALAGFYADYTDVQVPGSVGAVVNGVPTFVGVTTNAGKATFKGVELEMQARVARDLVAAGDRLNFSGTLGWIDAQYDEFVTNVPGQGPVDVADFRSIQNTPEWTLSGTVDYTVPVFGGDLSFLNTVSYRSLTNQFETPSPFLDQPGYALWDASIVWTSEDQRFTLGAHVKNITDKEYIVAGYQFLVTDPVTGQPLLNAAGNVRPSLGVEGVATAFYGNPRQAFVSFGVRF